MEAWELDALERAAECLARARYVIALTGAGLSVESGIPPFRGPGGLWTRHGEPPMDGYRGFLKSDTVSFGEPIPPDVLDQCFEEAEQADCMIVAGTSATVYPAAQFPITIHQRGGDLLEVNPYESEITALCRHALRGPAGEILPPLVERLRARL